MIELQAIEPPFWWTGFRRRRLQLMVYGQNIGQCQVSIDYPGIDIESVDRADSSNYLFVNLLLHDLVQAGSFTIHFVAEDLLVAEYGYELRKRKHDAHCQQGFDSSDAIYLLMPDRFAQGRKDNNHPAMSEGINRELSYGRHGGDLAGITSKLHYFERLGVTAIWLTPVFENNMPDYSYHGYAITDFYRIDPRYGSNKDYCKMVQKAHGRGLKVVMDMVFNHCGAYHWWMKDLPFKDWLHEHQEYTETNHRIVSLCDLYASEHDRKLMTDGWFVPSMPDLNQQQPYLMNYLTQNSLWWVEYSGIDAIRMDTYPYADQNQMVKWVDAVKREFPKLTIVGECWVHEPAFVAYWEGGAKNHDGFDSHLPCVMDFPMMSAIHEAFNEHESRLTGLSKLYSILAQDFLYKDPQKLMIFLDNHDTHRVFERIKNFRKWKMAVAFLLTIRGIPQIYYGTELLMAGHKDLGDGRIREDFPGGFPGDQKNAFIQKGRTQLQKKAHNFLRKLLNWRKGKNVIHRGKMKQFAPVDGLYVYFRYTDDEVVMVLLNHQAKGKVVDTSPYVECLEAYASAINVLTDHKLDKLESIRIEAWSAMVLELRK